MLGAAKHPAAVRSGGEAEAERRGSAPRSPWVLWRGGSRAAAQPAGRSGLFGELEPAEFFLVEEVFELLVAA